MTALRHLSIKITDGVCRKRIIAALPPSINDFFITAGKMPDSATDHLPNMTQGCVDGVWVYPKARD